MKTLVQSAVAVLAAITLCVRPAAAAQGDIATVAGDGTAGYSGDGGPATSAQINSAFGVGADTFGNLYIADSKNNCIRKVDLSGTITTVAGDGTAGYSGDGGPATSAQLSNPFGVAVDAQGNIYIADINNYVIRKVDTFGIITTVAGNTTPGYSGDGGPAISAQLDDPIDVAVDASGNLFIVDSSNDTIRKVDVSGTITTVAGNGIRGYSGDGGPATAAQLNTPQAVALDASGNIYIADLRNERVRKVDASGIITTVAGVGTPGFSGDGGQATLAELDDPVGVATDTAGNLFISDADNHRIRKVGTGGIISTVAGD